MAPAASEDRRSRSMRLPAAAEQQQERDVTVHQDSKEEEAAAAKIKELLSKLQPLRARISQLLGPAGPHRVVYGDAGRHCLAFMSTELSIIVAFLTTLSPQQWDLMEHSLLDVPYLASQVLREVDRSHHTLLQRATQCLHRRMSILCLPFTMELYYVSEAPSSYSHLLPTSSDLGLTPQLAEAKAGALHLVGIDGPAKKIFRWLAHQGKMDTSLRVMSIVGPVGIGKTALAVELRNRLRHETSGGRYYFQCNVMVKASRVADRNILLLQDILSQVSEPAAATARSADDPSEAAKTMEVLVHLVSDNLRDKRYFVSIDDIWDASDWEKIKGAFPNNNLDSRILVTTRSTGTAWACCSDSYYGLVHEMKPLSEMDSERLFLVKAVDSEDGCLSDNMKLLCDEILKRCDGVPLFIIGMAGWLKGQRLHKQHPREDEDEEPVPRLPERLEQALSSAVNDLPNDGLRSLLLYMSMFPYGYKFEKDPLVFKWIHEGLINWRYHYWELGADEAEGKSKAEAFFSVLVDRNVITCVASNCKNKHDDANACQWKVNHFLQQFLASKSAEMGFLFTTADLHLLMAALPATGHGNETRSRMPRRLALHHPHPQLPLLLETKDLSQTRSLYVSGIVSGIPLDKFVNLMLLDLEGWQNLKDEDLVQVCRSKMIFLRYLSVRNTRVSKLPHEIKELQLLGTLDVSYTQITELPLELFELRFLEHLDIRGTQISQLPKQIVHLRYRLARLLIGGEGRINSMETITRLPHDVPCINNLETLATVDLTEHPASFVRALGDLGNLTVLAVTWSFHLSTDRDYCKALLSAIRGWPGLKSLTIHCGLGCSMEFLGSLEKSRAQALQRLEKFKVTAGRFASVPPWIHGLEHLAFVEITVSAKQAIDDLKILGALPKLQCLILGLDFIPGQAIMIENEGFRELQRFSVDCPLLWLTFKAGAMRKLTYLQLKLHPFPASNTEVPSCINNLQSLSEVALCYNVRYANNPYVKETVKAVREAVAEHLNQIDLFINSIQDYDVQAVEPAEIATRTVSGTDAGARDDARPVDEKTTSAAVQSEITEPES